MLRLLGVARASFYQWLNKPISDRAIEEMRLLQIESQKRFLFAQNKEIV